MDRIKRRRMQVYYLFWDMIEVKINTEFIKLDSFMKFAGITVMGSEAKMLIQNEEVKVNGEVEVRRGKKIFKGDKVEVDGEIYIVV